MSVCVISPVISPREITMCSSHDCVVGTGTDSCSASPRHCGRQILELKREPEEDVGDGGERLSHWWLEQWRGDHAICRADMAWVRSVNGGGEVVVWPLSGCDSEPLESDGDSDVGTHSNPEGWEAR